MEQSDKKPYEPPTVTDHGDLRKITAGQAGGAVLDRDFPAGTPTGDICFS